LFVPVQLIARKTVSEVIYNVLSGLLNPSNSLSVCVVMYFIHVKEFMLVFLM